MPVDMYKQKYLLYKIKYLELQSKLQLEGGATPVSSTKALTKQIKAPGRYTNLLDICLKACKLVAPLIELIYNSLYEEISFPDPSAFFLMSLQTS